MVESKGACGRAGATVDSGVVGSKELGCLVELGDDFDKRSSEGAGGLGVVVVVVI